MSKICIDMGHALVGSVGARGCGFKEEVLTREVGNKVVAKLKALGHQVYAIHCDNADTRTDLNTRVSKINSISPDISCSIHFNAFNGNAYGTEVFTKGGSKFTEAVNVLNGLVGLGYRNRGIKNTGKGLALVDSVKCPKAMLVEVCFIDNAEDMAKFNADKVADVIVKGLVGQTTSVSAPAPAPAPAPAQKPSSSKSYSENGTFYFDTTVKIRTAPNLSSSTYTGVNYNAGESVIYHTVHLDKEGYNWIQYTRRSGGQGYCAVRDLKTGKRFGYAK